MTRPRIACSAPGLRDDAAGVRSAIERVISSGWFILGPEVAHFEAEFAAASGANYAVGVGNGTDAIALILRALDIGHGDEVITTALSAAYTALAIMMTGARPVFVDIDPRRMTIDPDAIAAAITPRTRALLPVHLYGQAADMDRIAAVASRHNLALVEDCAQAHLATANGRPVGTIGVAGAFSFYPTKNLGALGDGGAVVTNDAALADRVKRLRNGGQTERYHHQESGVNSRLDEMQAAILRVRLAYLDEWTTRRREVAAHYRRELAHAPIALLPECDRGHVYHLFVVLTTERKALRQHLSEQGIDTLVHYPVPIPRQPALAAQQPTACPLATIACDQVLSLPMHPALSQANLAEIAAAVSGFHKG
jgi:dTDP-4-amino-4,6-dideoxygalactose transaminase